MLSLFVDTSTWLDLSKRRDGQRWIASLRHLMSNGEVRLLVPTLIVDEFDRNWERIEQSMTATINSWLSVSVATDPGAETPKSTMGG